MEYFPHFSKPKQRFIVQVLYGMQAARDVKLSSIWRALDEGISMKKLEERLSRNLEDGDIEPRVRACIVRESARHVLKGSFIEVDPTDIRKFYAREMQHAPRRIASYLGARNLIDGFMLSRSLLGGD